MNNLPATLAQDVIELACTIQAIPAPTFHEEARAEFFFNWLQKAGLSDVQRDPAGNVLARLVGGTARPLVVSAHIDTVHPMGTSLTIKRAENRITGPGIGDNALGTAALLGLIQALQAEKTQLPGDLWVVFNTCEEGLGDLRGIQAVVDRFGAEPIAYLVIEGMGLGTVLHRGLGVERYKITAQTPGGHSWANYGQPSAVHELCGIVTRLAALNLPRSPCTTLNVGIIHGGTSINTIASSAAMELDLRSEDAGALEDLVSQVEEIIRSARRPGVKVTMDRIGKRSAGSISPRHPLVQIACGVLKDLGMETRLDIASTDANMPLSRGYPAICVGITNGNSAHTKEEYILTGQISKGMAQLYLLVTRVWSALEE